MSTHLYKLTIPTIPHSQTMAKPFYAVAKDKVLYGSWSLAKT